MSYFVIVPQNMLIAKCSSYEAALNYQSLFPSGSIVIADNEVGRNIVHQYEVAWRLW